MADVGVVIASLICGFQKDLPPKRKNEPIEGIYRALRAQHGMIQ